MDAIGECTFGKRNINVPPESLVAFEVCVRRLLAEGQAVVCELAKFRADMLTAAGAHPVRNGERLVSMDQVDEHTNGQGSVNVPPERLFVLEMCIRRLQDEGTALSVEHAKLFSATSMEGDASASLAADSCAVTTSKDQHPRNTELTNEPGIPAAGPTLIHSTTGASLASYLHDSMTGSAWPTDLPFRNRIMLMAGGSVETSPGHRKVGIDKVLTSTTSVGLWKAFFMIDLPSDHLVRVVSKISWSARLSLFMGGFAIMPHRVLQIIYDLAIFAAFVLCFVARVTDVHFKSAPHHAWGIEVTNAWFHIFGLHAWATWRTFACDEVLCHTVKCIVEQDRPDGKHCGMIIFMSRILLAGQIVAVITSIVAHPTAAWDYGHQMPPEQAQDGARLSAAAHAVMLWLAIPHQVSSVLAGIGLFCFVCEVHTKDAWLLLRTLQAYDGPTLGESMSRKSEREMAAGVLDCCEAVEALQDRLTNSCRKLSLLWMHMLVLAAASAFAVAVQANHLKNTQIVAHPDVDEDNKLIYWLAHDLFIAGLACFLCYTALLRPASVSRVFEALPRNVVKAMRFRGFSIPNISAALDFLKMEAVGYRIGTFQINERLATHFISFLSVMLSIALIEQHPAR